MLGSPLVTPNSDAVDGVRGVAWCVPPMVTRPIAALPHHTQETWYIIKPRQRGKLECKP